MSDKTARATGGASVEKTIHARSGWPLLLLTFVLAAACVGCIVTGATMLPPDDMPLTTPAHTMGVVLLVVGIVVLLSLIHI